MPKAMHVCSRPGCPNLTPKPGLCATDKQEADRRRGSRQQRGYDQRHTTFRRDVLKRDPICVRCGKAPSQHADHHPLSLRELQARGLDPYDPKRGRGLCQPCHSAETARHQPGGWNAR